MTTNFVERIGYGLAERLSINLEKDTHLVLADFDKAIGFPEVESSYGGKNGKESLDYERIPGVIGDREYLIVRRKTSGGERNLFVEYSDNDLTISVRDTDVERFLCGFLFGSDEGVYGELSRIAEKYATMQWEARKKGKEIDKIEETIVLDGLDRYNLEDLLLSIL